MNKDTSLIVTQGPYSSFMEEISNFPFVTGVRLNTIMPIKYGTIREKLEEMWARIHHKDLWIDLKCRQLRVTNFANTPYTSVKISHRISVDLPAYVLFDNGAIEGKLVDIDGYDLILEDYVGRIIGPGESINIKGNNFQYLDDRYLTERDMEFVEAAKLVGIRTFMLSFVHDETDVAHFKNIYNDSTVIAKIEDKKGMANVASIAYDCPAIMVARGDLCVEASPRALPGILQHVRQTVGDKAIVGSRLLSSLLTSIIPSCSDMMDIHYLKSMGYTTFMIGDDICFKRDILVQAMNLIVTNY